MSRDDAGATAEAEALREHIRGLEERLLDPALRRDRDAVGRLLADDFREVGSSGRVFDRVGILDALAAQARGAGDDARPAIPDFSLAVLAPDVVLATYRIETRAGPDAAPRSSLRSSVWVRRGGRWRMRFHQGTPAAPEA